MEQRSLERPVLKADHAIVKIRRVGICGTDIHAFEGTQPFFSYPRILGHELAGELVEADNAPGFSKNEPATILPYFSCGQCIACRSGKPNCCVSIQVFGVHTDGGMMEYISVPSSSLVHGRSLQDDQLALVEPLSISAHGIRRAAVRPGEQVLVVGAGPIGIAAMEFARLAGGIVIAMDVNRERLQFCKDQLHIPFTLHPEDDDVLREITGGNMPSVVIDATGNLSAINKGIYYLAHGGRYVLIGLQKEELRFSHPELHKRETTLLCSRNATREDFEYVINAIENGHTDPSRYITHHIDLENAAAVFSTLLTPGNPVIKAMIRVQD